MSSSDSDDEEWQQAEAQIKQHIRDVSELSSNASDSDFELSSLSPLRRLVSGDGGGGGEGEGGGEASVSYAYSEEDDERDGEGRDDEGSDGGMRGELPHPIEFVAVQKQRLSAEWKQAGGKGGVGSVQKGELLTATAIRAITTKGHRLEGVLRARSTEGFWASVFDEHGQRLLEMPARHGAVRPRRVKGFGGSSASTSEVGSLSPSGRLVPEHEPEVEAPPASKPEKLFNGAGDYVSAPAAPWRRSPQKNR